MGKFRKKKCPSIDTAFGPKSGPKQNFISVKAPGFEIKQKQREFLYESIWANLQGYDVENAKRSSKQQSEKIKLDFKKHQKLNVIISVSSDSDNELSKLAILPPPPPSESSQVLVPIKEADESIKPNHDDVDDLKEKFEHIIYCFFFD